MSIRKTIIVLLALSIIGIGTGYVFDKNYQFGLCYRDDGIQARDITCNNFYNSIGEPLTPAMSALAVVFLALAFLPHAFNAWRKFAMWGIPIALFFFIMEQGSNSGGLGGGIGFGPTDIQVYRWVSIAFVLTSLAIIAFVSLYRGKHHVKVPNLVIPIATFVLFFIAASWPVLWLMVLTLLGLPQ